MSQGNNSIEDLTGRNDLIVVDRNGNDLGISGSDIANRNPKALANGSIIDNQGFVYSKNADGSFSSRVATQSEIKQSGIQIDYDNLSTANSSQSPKPRNQNEQLAFDQVVKNPQNGTNITSGADERFSAGGFQKMQLRVPGPNGKNISIHYQYNPKTGQVVDMKVTSRLENAQ